MNTHFESFCFPFNNRSWAVWFLLVPKDPIFNINTKSLKAEQFSGPMIKSRFQFRCWKFGLFIFWLSLRQGQGLLHAYLNLFIMHLYISVCHLLLPCTVADLACWRQTGQTQKEHIWPRNIIVRGAGTSRNISQTIVQNTRREDKAPGARLGWSRESTKRQIWNRRFVAVSKICATRATKHLFQMVRPTSLASLWPLTIFLSQKRLIWFSHPKSTWVTRLIPVITCTSLSTRNLWKNNNLRRIPTLSVCKSSHRILEINTAGSKTTTRDSTAFLRPESLGLYGVYHAYLTFINNDIYLLSYGFLASFWIHTKTQWNKERRQTYSTTWFHYIL